MINKKYLGIEVVEGNLKSRRGLYNQVEVSQGLHTNNVVWEPEPLDEYSGRARAVRLEVSSSKVNALQHHPYWENEPKEFVDEYQKFYNKLFSLDWLNGKHDRHNIVVNEKCCLTLVQYHNGTLYAYSRSTDMRNGYMSDGLILDYLAECINKDKPECKVDVINWTLAIPHEYVEPGIARLKKDEENND